MPGSSRFFSVIYENYDDVDKIHMQWDNLLNTQFQKTNTLNSNLAALYQHATNSTIEHFPWYPTWPSDFRTLQLKTKTYSLLHHFLNNYPHLFKYTSLSPKRIESILSQLDMKMYPFLKSSAITIQKSFKQRGIVMTTGKKHFLYAMHAILALKSIIKTSLPIELLYNEGELDPWQLDELQRVGLTTIDITTKLNIPSGTIKGWAIKPFAILASSFEEVIFVDADVLFFQDPKHLFSSNRYQNTGTMFFYDRTTLKTAFEFLSTTDFLKRFLRFPSERLQKSRLWNYQSAYEMESGVLLLNKKKTMPELLTACLLNYGEYGKEMYKGVYGDKETYWTAWEMNGKDYYFVEGYAGAVGYLHEIILDAQLSKDFQIEKDDSGDPTLITEEYHMDGVQSSTRNRFKVGNYTCGANFHVDESGTPLWWNGGVNLNKNIGFNETYNFTHWAVQYADQKEMRFEWESDFHPFCLRLGGPQNVGELATVNGKSAKGELTVREKQLVAKYKSLWENILSLYQKKS